ncbi:isopeptide-forming domain-containing fimbrial protein [Collinsella aerofaciens]|uniref:isopeptide-forming domain-containing fimbrial protein n=1 Tax=Collinsella aerofaciens TaxID=74426 RepID=UPI0014855DF8|nr:isopeptide-forming domain-containing fimbrial protein [Collinsella aerofaciens]MDB1901588.1 isopeptide-forming domain-containing fimbrial protein [Collinsella aerofaciens]MDB1904739.1 isopeptide-forming domain-containing fimbrial protein [Collinsella aerofaciens]
MNKNIARLAVTAGLTAALSFGGVMAPVTMAFAAEGDDTITITQNENNGATKFKAYQIFKADVVDKDGQKVASNVDWASDQARDAVRGVLTSENAPGITNSSTAQEVADYLSEAIMDTTPTTVVKKDDLLNKIALAVEKDVPATGVVFDAGTPFTATSKGYYLFLTDTSSIGTKDDYADKKQTGTSPIFAVVGGKAVAVVEKTDIPTVEKKIKDDKSVSNWADKGDSQMGQPVNYQLTGTVAKNVDTFKTYYYQFHDELSAGLTADKTSVEVKVDGTKIASDKYIVDYDQANGNNLLTVTFNDLKSSGVTIKPNSKVVVTYTAKLDPDKAENVVVGGEGNDNSVKLIYSNNPGHDSKGESVPDTVRDYTYALKLVKEDSVDTDQKLKGVKFTIQATAPDEDVAQGTTAQCVQKNGSLGDSKYEFTTNDQGEISVKGLDAGTYTVHEVEGSNPGYNTLDDFTFTITAAGLDKAEGDNTLSVTTGKNGSNLVDTPSINGGTVTLTVRNKKGSGLPLTGLNGVTFTWIAGGAVLCIGVAHLIRSRKQAEESEQE